MTNAIELQIRQTTEQDVPLILTFIKELAEYEKLAEYVTTTEERLRNTLFGPVKYAEAFIAYQANEPVAFAVFYFGYSTFSARPNLYLEDIYVRPSHRKHGIGRKLFSFLARKAIERDCGRLELAVLNWNEPAMAFYRKLAAEPAADWTVFHLSRARLETLASEDAT